MLHAVIMAGGAGTRFWPASRKQSPKQLLNLLGEKTMIQLTAERLEGLVPPERTLVVTNESLVTPIREQLPALPEEAVVGEPCKRDTAPCIGLAALLVARKDPQATMVVLPADHAIQDTEAFRRALAYGAELVESAPGRIVTFGVPPTYPAETYGYIERGERLAGAAGQPPTYRVRRFREKPDAQTAREFVSSGEFYWNGGIFLWKARTILDALAKHQPEMSRRLETIGEALGAPDYPRVLQREFSAMEAISIDYAVMERAEDVAVIETPFDWDDIGAWRALARLRGADERGNTLAAKRCVALETSGTILRADDNHLVVTLGVEDLIVVQTPDATLIAHKDHEESIRDVVKRVQQEGWEEYL